jgi:nucleotide-binding universal stress UspA family protein
MRILIPNALDTSKPQGQTAVIEKILLAISGIGQAEAMMQSLLDIPGFQRAKVTILHVVPPEVNADVMVEKLEVGGKLLANAVQLLKLSPQQVNPMLRQGDAKTIVCQVADEIDADLIIMGSRGLKRLQSILENSVSQYVFQLSSHPMLLVKDGINVKRQINRVMVAIDTSETAQQSLKLALFMLRDVKGGQLILARVTKDARAADGNPEKDPILEPAIAEAKRMGVSYKCVVGIGKAGEEICRLADETHADLLILGSPDRRPSVAKSLPDLDRLLGTSISDYVRVYAECPILLTRTAA